MMLYRQPCLADPARRSREAILGLRYFGPAKVVKGTCRWGRGADFVAFDCTTAAHGHVPETAAIVPEMSIVLYCQCE
jgi:hypothetical protein